MPPVGCEPVGSKPGRLAYRRGAVRGFDRSGGLVSVRICAGWGVGGQRSKALMNISEKEIMY